MAWRLRNLGTVPAFALALAWHVGHAEPEKLCLTHSEAAAKVAAPERLNLRNVMNSLNGLEIVGKSGKKYKVKVLAPMKVRGVEFVLYEIYDEAGTKIGYGNRGVDEANNNFTGGQIIIEDAVNARDEGIAKEIYTRLSDAAPAGAGMKISSEEARTNTQLAAWMKDIELEAGYKSALAESGEAADRYRSARLTERVAQTIAAGEPLPFWIGFMKNRGWGQFTVEVQTDSGTEVPNAFVLNFKKQPAAPK